MTPVECQRFHLDDDGREVSGQLVIVERGLTKRVRLHPCELVISCDSKDSSGLVTIKGDVEKITTTILWDQDELEIPTAKLKKPLEVLGSKRLFIRSQLTGHYVEIRHTAS